MNKGEKLALFLGMLSGDGCLSIGHNGEGYRDYPIQFYNTDREKVVLFEKLLFELFAVHARIISRRRPNRKEIWELNKKSRATYEKIRDYGFPEGVKRDILRIPEIVKNGTDKEKLHFIQGVLITDGSVNSERILFHSGSKLFLEDMSKLIGEFIEIDKPIKGFVQREIYKSYQLCLNKKERDLLLSRCPRGTMVLR
ncbi:MAG: hypothetical protein MUF61_02500 [archaeon]|nr:hypothetical protein [archaeon]